jgi:hypothetical protein
MSARRTPCIVFPLAILGAGCILFVDDDPSAFHVVTAGGGSNEAGGGGGGDDGSPTGNDGGAAYPDAAPPCLPPFMTGTLNACLPCLAAKCEKEFAQCCADTSCRNAATFQTTPLLTAVDNCESNNCADLCDGTECHSGTGICSCIAASPLPTPNATCTESTVPGSLCCASFDYPSAGSCECSVRDSCTSGLKLVAGCYPYSA